MAVLKEFKCKAHGAFEAFAGDELPECPQGCHPRWVTREIRTPPAARGIQTGTLDQLQRGIAHDFGLSDLKNDKHSNASVMDTLRKGEDMRPKWVDVPGKMKEGWASRGEKAAPVDIGKTFGMQSDNALARVNPSSKIPTNVVGKWDGK